MIFDRLGPDRISAGDGQATLPLGDDADATSPTRRSMLKAGMLGLAGIAGWTAAAKSTGRAGDSSAAVGAVGAVGAAGSLKLGGSGFAFGEDDAGAFTTQGELLGPTGASLGSFHSAPLGATAGDLNLGAQFQTFNLDDGSIFGIGAGSPDGESASTFAIVGGTGEYSGAAGSYLADLRPVDAGGDGSAQFDFTFTQLRGKDGKR